MLNLDGPATNGSISVTTSPVELKVGASVLSERIAVVVQPLGADIYWGYDSNVTASTGFKLFKDVLVFMGCGEELPIYLVASSGSVDTRIGEVG